MRVKTIAAKNRSKSIALITGILLCLLPVLFNQWTLKFFFAGYIGESLFTHFIILLWLLAACSITLGLAVIKYGLCILREIWIIALFCIPAFITTTCLFFFVGEGLDAANVFYGKLLCTVICTVLTLIFFRWGIVLGVLLVGLLSIIEIIYAFSYKTLISPSVLYNLFETNIQEAKGYLAGYFSNLTTLVSIAVTAIICFLIFKSAAGLNRKRTSLYLIVLSSVLIVPLAFGHGYKKAFPENLLFKVAKGYREYKLLYTKVNEFSNKPLDEIEPVGFSRLHPENELHVLIIGESADRDHMGIYGFNRNNTPKMQAMSDELFLFSDVISVHKNTIPNMEKMLTFANYDNDRNAFEKGSLIHYLKKGGFQTHWISNQNPMGVFETMTTVLAKACDSTVFVNNAESFMKTSRDEKILPVLKKVISDKSHPRKFIFVHIMGSHAPFYLRYPAEYEIFKDGASSNQKKNGTVIGQYHNSILYTDHIVTEIIKIAKKTQNYASVLYISDHGLDVYDSENHCGHSYELGLEIPFVLWISDKFKNSDADRIARLSGYTDRKYTTDDIFFSICDLMNLKFDSFDPTRSIFNETFRQKQRMVGTPNKKMMWDYDSKNPAK